MAKITSKEKLAFLSELARRYVQMPSEIRTAMDVIRNYGATDGCTNAAIEFFKELMKETTDDAEIAILSEIEMDLEVQLVDNEETRLFVESEEYQKIYGI